MEAQANTVGAAKSPDQPQDGYEAFYQAHAGRVFALILRMVADRQRAADLTQEAFVRAYEKRATFEARSTVSTWLHRLAINVVLEDRRKTQRRDKRIAIVDELEAQDPSPRSPHIAIDLERAIASLPEGARTVLILYDVEGFQHDEIARLLEVSVGTSKAQLFRARKLLREALDR
jgi:RNA polymerase sigma-70 factor (ECF subfamily)